jgi:hypothetical protein
VAERGEKKCNNIIVQLLHESHTIGMNIWETGDGDDSIDGFHELEGVEVTVYECIDDLRESQEECFANFVHRVSDPHDGGLVVASGRNDGKRAMGMRCRVEDGMLETNNVFVLVVVFLSVFQLRRFVDVANGTGAKVQPKGACDFHSDWSCGDCGDSNECVLVKAIGRHDDCVRIVNVVN